MRALGSRRRDLVLIALTFVAAAVVGRYILEEQGFLFPWDPEPFELRAEFSTAQAVTPGQGQAVRISGVRVGELTRAELKDGKAIVTMRLKPKYRSLLRVDASALLRPRTSLKDMFLELNPGSEDAARMPEDFTIPVANTLPDINPDQVNSVLDADTRDYLRLLLGGFGDGLRRRGRDLREILRLFEPTHRHLARVSTAVARRRKDLRELVHALNELNDEFAEHPVELSELIATGSQAFTAMGSQKDNIADSVAEMPAALQATTAAMTELERFGRVLDTESDRLGPVFAELDHMNRRLIPFARLGAPILRESIRPFVRAARPVARELTGPAGRLAASSPDLTRSFEFFNRFFNMAAHNPRGREGPDDPDRQEGFLFWAAWLGHILPSEWGTADARGSMLNLGAELDCVVLRDLLDRQALGAVGATLAPALADPTLCP